MYDRISGEQWLNTKEQQLGALNSLESAHCQNLGLQPNLGWDVLAPHVTNVGFGVEMRHSWLRYPMKFMNLWHSRPPVMPSYVEWIWFISLFTLILYTISAVKKKMYVTIQRFNNVYHARPVGFEGDQGSLCRLASLRNHGHDWTGAMGSCVLCRRESCGTHNGVIQHGNWKKQTN